MLLVTLLVAGCSKPEEVISRRVAQANQNLEAGDVSGALGILEKLNQSHPGETSVLEALGFAYSRSGRPAEAAAAFVRAADGEANFGSLRLLAAEGFLQAGVIDRAAEQHRLYLQQFPAEYQSWKKLGDIEERLGNPLRATDAYLECYRLRPSSEVAFRLGSVFRKLNNGPQAAAWYEATIKHAESHVDQALLGLLELEISARNFAAAARTIQQLETNYPGVIAASPLAGAPAEITAWREAQATVEAARAAQERVAQELAASRREQQEAIAASLETPRPMTAATVTPAQETPAVNSPAPVEEPPAPQADAVAPIVAEVPATPAPLPTTPEARLAREKMNAGEHDLAIAILWEALGRNDRAVDLWLELGDCYRRIQRFPDAEACLLEAGRRAPDAIEVETAYLNLIRESQPTEVFLARVEAARQKFPADADLAFLLAHACAGQPGETLRGIKAYEDFLLLADPADPRREEAIAFLARTGRR